MLKIPDFYRSHKILDIIGEGAFGLVYKTRKLDKNIFAVKRIETDENDDCDPVEEGMQLDQLSHPNIVKYFGVDCGTSDRKWQHKKDKELHKEFQKSLPYSNHVVKKKGSPTMKFIYLVMEYCGGLSLDKFIKVKENRVPRYGFTIILSALSYMHAQAILHRDLKPGNVMVDPAKDHAVKVIDFGLSCDAKKRIQNRQRDCSRLSYVNFQWSHVGTQLYQPAEQSTEEYSALVDVYSAGLVAAELFNESGMSERKREKYFMQIRANNRLPEKLQEKIYPDMIGTIAKMIESKERRLEAEEVLNEPDFIRLQNTLQT